MNEDKPKTKTTDTTKAKSAANKNFAATVRAMSAKEIILAMVESLQNPVTVINMGTFGYTETADTEDTICYGCAATNTICKIAGIDNKKDFLYYWDEAFCDWSYDKLATNYDFMYSFERAINYLRCGIIDLYNIEAKSIGIAVIKCPPVLVLELPILTNNYSPEELQAYIRLAEYQESSDHSNAII